MPHGFRAARRVSAPPDIEVKQAAALARPPLIVRHRESAGNVARDAAMKAGAERIDIRKRDVDVSLSRLGEEPAGAVGRWSAELPAEQRPEEYGLRCTVPRSRFEDFRIGLFTLVPL